MRHILSSAGLLASLTFSGAAFAQMSTPPQNPAPTEAQAKQADSSLPVRTFEGKVKDFSNNTVSLDVAGDTVKIKASKTQTAILRKGETVRVQARPSLEATKVQAQVGAFAGDTLVGKVDRVENNQLLIRSESGALESVHVDEKTAKQVQPGSTVVVVLKEDPAQAKTWQATDIQPIRSTM